MKRKEKLSMSEGRDREIVMKILWKIKRTRIIISYKYMFGLYSSFRTSL